MTTKQAIEEVNKYLEFRRVDIEHYPESKHKTKAEQLTQAIEILIQQTEKMDKVRELNEITKARISELKLLQEDAAAENDDKVLLFATGRRMVYTYINDKLTKIINE